MPVLGLADWSVAVLFLFALLKHLPTHEQLLQVRGVDDRHALGGPTVPLAKELTAKEAAWSYCPGDPGPQFGKGERLAKGQGEAGIDQVAPGQFDRLEAGLKGCQACLQSSGRALAQLAQGLVFGVYCQHLPALLQQGEAVAPGAAAQVQRGSRRCGPAG